jgi:hypothetical protein
MGAALDGVVIGLLLRGLGSAGLRGAAALLIAIIVSVAYLALASRLGGTIGNLATGTVVVSQATGASLGWGRALARAIAVAWLVLSVIGVLVDVAYPTFDVRRQMLHDLAGASQVVLRRRGHRAT